MRFLAALFGVLGLAASAVPAVQAQAGWGSGEPIIDAQLVADQSVVVPGERFHVGVHQMMPEGWHTYWRNPGDNGLPITLDWDVPEGVTIGEIAWPAPTELPLTDAIMDYGYKGEVVLPLPVSLAADYAAPTVPLRVQATWLVCEEICIPEERELSLTLPVGEAAQRDEDGYWYIRSGLDAVPPRAEDIDATLSLSGDRVVLAMSGGPFAADGPDWRGLKFFPHEAGIIEHAVEQAVTEQDGEVVLVTAPGYRLDQGVPGAQGGVITFEAETDTGWESRALEIEAEAAERDFQLGGLAGASGPSGPPANLFLLFIAALAGGLILNLMPCVFPILSIKVLKFVQAAHSDAAAVRHQSLVFLAGVVLSFVLLATLMVVLREVGLPVGWGFQLQVPVVVAVLALLLFAIGLNLLGVFEVGSQLMGIGAGLADKPGWKGAFFTGVLAVVVAAPCVGPLAAGALGLALTQPAPVVLLVAAALGLGLGAPFVLFSFFPGLLSRLPRPGGWMITFRQFLAFPMFASALWLAWVLAIQSGPQAVLYLGMAVLALSFAVWAHGRGSTGWRVVALIALIGVIVPTLWVSRLPPAGAATVSAEREAWSRDRVAELRAEGRAVFVDVTAAWCVTCQVNKMRVLDDAAVEAAFAQTGVAFLVADWTNRNEAIARLITEHGQAGVPLYLVYPADGGPARVLPTVLSKDGVIAALEAAI